LESNHTRSLRRGRERESAGDQTTFSTERDAGYNFKIQRKYCGKIYCSISGLSRAESDQKLVMALKAKGYKSLVADLLKD
jgi:hypothetical protein